jgi:hypothetical protein
MATTVEQRRGCSATRLDGDRCGGWALNGSEFCLSHDPSKREEQHAFRVKGGENRRKPKVTDVLRERVEAELDAWLHPFYAARDGDDPQLALKAAESVLGRVYGRPKQTNELSGPGRERHHDRLDCRGGEAQVERCLVGALLPVSDGARSARLRVGSGSPACLRFSRHGA